MLLTAPHGWMFRPETYDRIIFDSVVLHNEYALPERFDPRDILVDVGAHIGSFSFAVLERGAGTVYSYEVEESNFKILQHNLRPYQQRAVLMRAAVWRSDETIPQLFYGRSEDSRNTGGGGISCTPTDQPVPVLKFDDLIRKITHNGKQRIRLLKIDCEGAEWPILLTSRALHLIDALCGEYHLANFGAPFQVQGYPEFTPQVLQRRLEDQGFTVQVRPTPGTSPLGTFSAQNAKAITRTHPTTVAVPSGETIGVTAPGGRMIDRVRSWCNRLRPGYRKAS